MGSNGRGCVQLCTGLEFSKLCVENRSDICIVDTIDTSDCDEDKLCVHGIRVILTSWPRRSSQFRLED